MRRAAYSLDQFQVFLVVVDQGGFAAAARKLGRAQSAVTYAIRGLEEQTGLILFDRAPYRPVLTEAGKALLPRARRLLEDLDDFQVQAEGFAKGLEPSLSLAVNEFADLVPVMGALAALQERFPLVRVRLQRKPFGEDVEAVRQGAVTLGVVSGIVQLGHEFESRQLSDTELVAVAAPRHPLAALAGPIDLAQLRGHHQLVWTRDSSTTGQDYGVHALDTWLVTDLETKLRLLRAGLGWGSMPRHMVHDDLQATTLKVLNMQSWEGRERMPEFPTLVIRLRKTPVGPATRLFVDELVEQHRRRHMAAPEPR